MGNGSYQLTSAGRSAHGWQIGRHRLAGNSYFQRWRIFIYFFLNPWASILKDMRVWCIVPDFLFKFVWAWCDRSIFVAIWSFKNLFFSFLTAWGAFSCVPYLFKLKPAPIFLLETSWILIELKKLLMQPVKNCLTVINLKSLDKFNYNYGHYWPF